MLKFGLITERYTKEPSFTFQLKSNNVDGVVNVIRNRIPHGAA